MQIKSASIRVNLRLIAETIVGPAHGGFELSYFVDKTIQLLNSLLWRESQVRKGEGEIYSELNGPEAAEPAGGFKK